MLDLTACFGRTYAGRRVLVTGHTGFKGSWLVTWLRALGADVGGLALDPDTAPSHWDDLGTPLAFDHRIDIRDAPAVARAVASFSPALVFHLAAQPLVRRGYADPLVTYAVNVMGVVNLFEAVRAVPGIAGVVNATTDKVYEAGENATPFRERDPLGGHDPYSASKACAEVVTASYRRSWFGGPDAPQLATARAGNVVGGGDWAEDRLVPDLVRSVAAGTPLALRNPAATRPWQHVLEPLSGYLSLGEWMLRGERVDEAWNFGPPPAETSVGEIVERLRRHWPALAVASSPGPHPHEAGRLQLDSTKAATRLGWRPVWNTAETLVRTAGWYHAYLSAGELRTAGDLYSYVDDARRAGVAWTR